MGEKEIRSEKKVLAERGNMVTLKEFLIENGLLRYVERYSGIQSGLNRIHIDRYREIENGYEFHSRKSTYRVTVQRSRYGDGYTYIAEKARYFPSNGRLLGMFFDIPCQTRFQECAYPMVVAWIGTALADRANSENEKDELQMNVKRINLDYEGDLMAFYRTNFEVPEGRIVRCCSVLVSEPDHAKIREKLKAHYKKKFTEGGQEIPESDLNLLTSIKMQMGGPSTSHAVQEGMIQLLDDYLTER